MKSTISNPDVFETTNRKLESFLYIHGITYDSQYRKPDGMTAWCYNRDEFLDSVVREFRTVCERRAQLRRQRM